MCVVGLPDICLGPAFIRQWVLLAAERLGYRHGQRHIRAEGIQLWRSRRLPDIFHTRVIRLTGGE